MDKRDRDILAARAAFDQMRESSKDIAAFAADYRRQLREAGFSNAESFALTLEWTRVFWMAALDPNRRREP